MIVSILKKLTFIGFVSLLVFAITACGFEKETIHKLGWKVNSFTYTDQNNKTFGLSDLKGKVWLADFFYTSCPTVCTPMTAHMATIQKKLKDDGLDVQIVSFSVDPHTDTSQELLEFGQKFNADFSNWHFLSGYTVDQIKQLSEGSFKTALDNSDPNQVVHGTSFFLVDGTGTIVQKYDGIDTKTDQQLIQDIKSIEK